MTQLTIPFLGAERAGRQYPFADLHAAGARLVAGSDWPVSTPDPLAAIHTAVHRTSYGEPAPAGTDPFLPEQALADRGRLRRLHQRVGVGEPPRRRRHDQPGAVADLVVLDRDPFQDPHEIGAARVRSTWIDGECVYESAG